MLGTARRRRCLPLLLLIAAACAPQRGTMGAMLAQDGQGRVSVREVPEGLAADRAGLQPGDEILLIDGRDVRPLTDRQLHEALAGEVGSTVKLTVVRGEEILRVTLRLTAARKHRLERSEDAAPEAE